MRHFCRLTMITAIMVVLSTGLFSNGLNLNGNGSKAISMGGAFVGLADDYSAVFWNPAGLTQMKKSSLSLFVTDVFPSGSYFLDLGVAQISAETEPGGYLSGGLGFFKPLSDKVVVGIYAYVPSGLGANWPGEDLALLSGGMPMVWETMVGIVTVSPTVAFKLSDKLSLGATLNINYGMDELKRPTELGQYEEDLDGFGFSATIGLLYKPSDKFSFGMTYKTPMKATVKGDVTMPGAQLLGLAPSSEGEREITWPMWFGAGIAVKPSERLTFTFDVQYTNWGKMDEVEMTFADTLWQAFLADGSTLTLLWEDKTQIRFGMEYMINPKLALRAGYYYDPSPSPKATMNILLPEITYNFFTLGIGYKTEKMALDFCLEYGKGKDVTVMEPLMDVGMPGVHSMDLFVPNIAVTFFF